MSWSYDNSLPLLWLCQNALPAVKYIRLHLSLFNASSCRPTGSLPTLGLSQKWATSHSSFDCNDGIYPNINQILLSRCEYTSKTSDSTLTYTSQFNFPYLPTSVPQYAINIIIHLGISITGSFTNTASFGFIYGGKATGRGFVDREALSERVASAALDEVDTAVESVAVPPIIS